MKRQRPSTRVIAIKDIIRPPMKENFDDVYIVYELMDTDLHQIIRSHRDLTDDHCQLIGSPDESGLGFLRSDNARRYVRMFPQLPKQNVYVRFPNVSPGAVYLLEKMLVFDPNKRITVVEALCHLYLAPFMISIRSLFAQGHSVLILSIHHLLKKISRSSSIGKLLQKRGKAPSLSYPSAGSQCPSTGSAPTNAHFWRPLGSFLVLWREQCELSKITKEPGVEELAFLFQIGSPAGVPRGQFYAKAKNKFNFIIPRASRKDPTWKEEWILVGGD
ncbi:hypothetical protein Ddye_023482 [Dipteronia dyeriana]|uniref:Protein kinase domain-containing protein n=1 Tax=Dipteronia dyeriana TaxID=168575 RepID=A0AAD9TTZ1_9ROSI|nr:hypothetical protein Ddye_023482 [Dipteronia dyeriana]